MGRGVSRILLGCVAAALLATIGISRPTSAACIGQTLDAILLQVEPRRYPNSFGPNIGLEIEGYVPGTDRKGVAEHIAKVVTRRNPGLKVSIQDEQDGSYSVRWLRDGRSYEWQAKKDATIHPPMGHIDVEVTSPILRSAADLVETIEVMKELKESAGMKALPASTGMHVHIGFEDPHIAELNVLHEIFSSLEDELMSVFSMADGRKDYAAPIKTANVKNALSVQGFLNEILDRHKALNFLALDKFGTVEFRLFNSTVDGDAISLAVGFTQKLVWAIRAQDPKLLTYLRQTPPERISLHGVAAALGVDLAKHEPTFKRLAAELQANLKEQADRPAPPAPRITHQQALLVAAIIRQPPVVTPPVAVARPIEVAPPTIDRSSHPISQPVSQPAADRAFRPESRPDSLPSGDWRKLVMPALAASLPIAALAYMGYLFQQQHVQQTQKDELK